jgi:aryl-alcohol dehydrogenase-like predicted oxidoreductase
LKSRQQDSAVADSHRALDLALNRYTDGLVAYRRGRRATESACEFTRGPADSRGGQLVAAVELVKALGGGWEAEKYNFTPGQLAIAWSLAQPGVTHALVGARDENQAVENARAGSVLLDAGDVTRITAAAQTGVLVEA